MFLRSNLVYPKPYLTSKIDLECTKNHVKMINQKVFVYNIDWREQESCISNIDSLWKSKNAYNTCIYVSITQEYIMLYHWKTKHDYPVMND